MGEIIEVIYENGVLKPLKPLKLKEGQRLRVRVYSDDFLELTREMRKKVTPAKFKEDPTDYLLRLREEET
ncbi:antitoxin AF2212-like protein [Thermococcus thermotolerans]|uniref:antitoxin AF2212-like protein n=1 Tax=Thermococcus thermotolerans TaxID=2969672 RepID=UPI002157D100|nr:antitoxin AF2212-like protein [Thermococcus thermotolerans]